MPRLGVAGAAYATVIGQFAAAILGYFFHKKLNREVEQGIRYMRPDKPGNAPLLS